MEEFAIGMHLVESAKSGKPLPSTLPQSLLPQQFRKSRSESIESENMEGMPGGQIPRQRSVSSSSANDELAFLRSGKNNSCIIYLQFVLLSSLNFTHGVLRVY